MILEPRNLKKRKKVSMQKTRGKTFQTEGKARAEVLRQSVP